MKVLAILLVCVASYFGGHLTGSTTVEALANLVSEPDYVSCIPVKDSSDAIQCENLVVEGFAELVQELKTTKRTAQALPPVIACRRLMLPMPVFKIPSVHSCTVT